MRRRTIRLIKEWAARQERCRVEPHPPRDRGDDVEHPVDSQRPDPRRRNVHQIRALIDEHPHTVSDPGCGTRGRSPPLLIEEDVSSLRFEPGAVMVQTLRPDAFYSRLTELAASGEGGAIEEVTSPR
jgi:hypothetical protein